MRRATVRTVSTGIAPDYPSIAGQNERYLLTQLRMIKSGERPAPLMSGQLDMVSDDDLAAMAAYYAAMPAQVGRSSADTVDAGMRIYRGGILEKGVAACTACHSPTGGGNAPAGYPHISGQRFDYVVAQLVAYREGRRKTDEAYGGMMRDVAGAADGHRDRGRRELRPGRVLIRCGRVSVKHTLRSFVLPGGGDRPRLARLANCRRSSRRGSTTRSCPFRWRPPRPTR